MNPVARSLLYAFANLLHPRMLWLMIWPMLIALAVWGTVLWFWARRWWLRSRAGCRNGSRAGPSSSAGTSAALIALAAKVLMFLMFVPLVWLTALLILSAFGMPAMVEHVASRRFPQLARSAGRRHCRQPVERRGRAGGLVGLGLISIPFWLLPPLWPLIPVAIMGWLNQRVLRYDALAEHASHEEMLRIFASRRGTLFAMGAILALLAYVPFVGFIAPVLVRTGVHPPPARRVAGAARGADRGRGAARLGRSQIRLTGRSRPRIAATSFSSAAGR